MASAETPTCMQSKSPLSVVPLYQLIILLCYLKTQSEKLLKEFYITISKEQIKSQSFSFANNFEDLFLPLMES